MNTPVVGINIGEEKGVATYLAQEGDVRDKFELEMNSVGYQNFASRIPKNTRIAFEASGLAYVVNDTLKQLGYNNISGAHS